MNAFYGNPNLSPETEAAIEKGARAPEVYSPNANEPVAPEQNRAAETRQAQNNNPAEAFFSQTTEQIDISSQAVALQQQQQQQQVQQQQQQRTANSPAETGGTPEPSANVRPPAPREASGANAAGAGQNQAANQAQATPRAEPRAASGLNSEPRPPLQPEGTNINQPQTNAAFNPLQNGYAQFGNGPGAASNASQPGALLSAMG